MYTGEGGGPLQSWLRVFIHFLLTLCLPSGSQPQPGSCLCACFSWHQAVGCHPLTPSCWSFPSSATHRAEATAREAVDTRPLDTGQQAPTSSGQHKPSQLLGPCSPGQCEPMAFYWLWQKSFYRAIPVILLLGLREMLALVLARTHWKLQRNCPV